MRDIIKQLDNLETAKEVIQELRKWLDAIESFVEDIEAEKAMEEKVADKNNPTPQI